MNRETLERHKFIAQHMVNEAGLGDMIVADAYYDYMIGMIVHQFTARIYGKRRTHRVDYPASWWEHFKRDVLGPFWTGDKGECKMSATIVDMTALYPELSMAIGKENPSHVMEVHYYNALGEE